MLDISYGKIVLVGDQALDFKRPGITLPLRDIKAREIINKVDKQMADLFVERMGAAKLVAEYKSEHGMQIFDPVREQEVIARNTALVSEELQPYYKEYLQMLMDISKKYQKDLLKGE